MRNQSDLTAARELVPSGNSGGQMSGYDKRLELDMWHTTECTRLICVHQMVEDEAWKKIKKQLHNSSTWRLRNVCTIHPPNICTIHPPDLSLKTHYMYASYMCRWCPHTAKCQTFYIKRSATHIHFCHMSQYSCRWEVNKQKLHLVFLFALGKK